MTFSNILLKSFSENLTQLIKITEMNHIFYSCIFQENRRILNCFHRRHEFCMQKYPNKCIFIECADKAQFLPIFSKTGKILILLYLSSHPSENICYDIF